MVSVVVAAGGGGGGGSSSRIRSSSSCRRILTPDYSRMSVQGIRSHSGTLRPKFYV